MFIPWLFIFQFIFLYLVKSTNASFMGFSVFVSNEESNQLNICGNQWIPYKTDKCFRILDKLGTEEEAKSACSQLDRTATLISIGSVEEQEFLNEKFFKSNNISDKLWLGMNIHELVLKPWNNQIYTNWADGSADLTGYNSCIQMSLSKTTLGKWTDEPCRRRALIACQRPQEWKGDRLRDVMTHIDQKIDSIKFDEYIRKQNEIIVKLQKTVDNQMNLIIEQNITISSLNRSVEKLLNQSNRKLVYNEISGQNTIPIGFTYIQLANQSEPTVLWPRLNWLDITKQYSGLFFRAEGENSLPFGQIQKANHSRITNVMSTALIGVNYTKVHGKHYTLEEGWSDNLVPAKALSDLYFYTTEEENRPINTAIRIWTHCA